VGIEVIAPHKKNRKKKLGQQMALGFNALEVPALANCRFGLLRPSTGIRLADKGRDLRWIAPQSDVDAICGLPASGCALSDVSHTFAP
jgi:hypothetical protein